MPERVRGDVFARDGRAGRRGGDGVLGDEAPDGAAADLPAAAGGEQRVVGPAAALLHPDPENCCGLLAQRGAAVFAALSGAVEVSPGAELDVAVAQAGPGGPVRGGQQGVCLGLAEVAQLVALCSLGGDGQDPGDEPGVFGVTQRRVAEEGADGGQARVPGAHAIAPFLLQVVQEAGDEGRVEVGQVQLAGLLAGAVLRVAQQEPPAVAVGGHGVGAGVALAGEPAGEERLQGGGESAHEAAPSPVWRRSAARASSSGTADRYQLFRCRNNWYYSDSRVIPIPVPLHA